MSLKQKSLVVFFGGAMDSVHKSMYNVYLKYKKEYEKENYKMKYYYWTCQTVEKLTKKLTIMDSMNTFTNTIKGFEDLAALIAPGYIKVAAEITRLYRNPYEHIYIVGHSYGGDTAMKVASLCICPIRLLATLDPVSLSAYKELIIPLPPIIVQYSKPTNVAMWINVYAPLSEISTLGGHWGSQTKASKNFPVLTLHGRADIMFDCVREYLVIYRYSRELQKNTREHIQELSGEPFGFGHGQSFMQTINNAFEKKLKESK